MKHTHELRRLRSRIEKFVEHRDITLTSFGRRALNTPNFMARLDDAIRGKTTMRASTLQRAREYLTLNGG